MFQYSAFNIFKFITMHSHCSHCNQNFEPEPGFYFGAMYVSYLFNSFIFLGTALVSTFYFEKSLSFTFATLFVLALVILPYTLRVSRTIWLAFNQK